MAVASGHGGGLRRRAGRGAEWRRGARLVAGERGERMGAFAFRAGASPGLAHFGKRNSNSVKQQCNYDAQPTGHNVPVALLELGRKLHLMKSALFPRTTPAGVADCQFSSRKTLQSEATIGQISTKLRY